MEAELFPNIPLDLPPEEVVMRCVRAGADSKVSDLFFSTHENHISVSVRHLGFIRLMTVMPLELGRRCITHIKVMAGMDVAERRRPLDGRWVRDVGSSHKVDLRISTIPTLYGEDLAMRLLIREFGLLDLEELGLMQRNLNQLVDMLNSPSGLILVTGPTGSGKTTTLYACLKQLNNGQRKINTIEDPIEYAIEGIRQSQVNVHIQVDFPDLLRAVLRQSPDVIMIGEIRDPMTAETAVRAANSGHLVLATLHAPVSAGAIQSMLSLGVHPHFLSSSLRGVIAQRLVRTLCPKCKEPFDLSYAPQTFEDVRQWLAPGEGESLYVAKGCNDCLQTGYASRTGIFEVLPISAAQRQMILDRQPTQVLRDKALKEGLIEMRQVALLKVARGETTVEELLRVIPVEFLGLGG
jgi:type II secretory ATPase GspE/PulE/Tfp pilus assembly ATPase PilB-like protein